MSRHRIVQSPPPTAPSRLSRLPTAAKQVGGEEEGDRSFTTHTGDTDPAGGGVGWQRAGAVAAVNLHTAAAAVGGRHLGVRGAAVGGGRGC